MNSKWVKELKVRLATIKPLEENTGRTLFDIKHSKIFLIYLLMKIQTKINKWDLIKQKHWHSKGNHKQNQKTVLRMGENICK